MWLFAFISTSHTTDLPTNYLFMYTILWLTLWKGCVESHAVLWLDSGSSREHCGWLSSDMKPVYAWISVLLPLNDVITHEKRSSSKSTVLNYLGRNIWVEEISEITACVYSVAVRAFLCEFDWMTAALAPFAQGEGVLISSVQWKLLCMP